MSGYEGTRRYRMAHPDACEREKRRNAARQRALVQLARAFPDEFRRIYHGELEASGLARARDTRVRNDGAPR